MLQNDELCMFMSEHFLNGVVLIRVLKIVLEQSGKQPLHILSGMSHMIFNISAACHGSQMVGEESLD
jgi:hypothetical protein